MSKVNDTARGGAGGSPAGDQPTAALKRIVVAVGPGQHAEQLLGCLRRAGLIERVVYSWPRVEVHRSERPGELRLEHRVPWFSVFVRVLWGVWRRIPRIGRSEYPRVWVNSLFDRLAARWVGSPALFVGWSQVSLRSMGAAHRAGATVVLEHPMAHVRVWRDILPVECARLGLNPRSCYGAISDAMARRMEAEYAAADLIVVPSSFAAESFVAAGVPRTKLRTIPIGVDTRLFRPAESAQRSRPFCALFAGRLEVMKGITYLLEAWKKARLDGAELKLVGPILPEMRGVLAQYRESGIRALGAVSRDVLAGLYRLADAFVFPSLNEGQGLVVLEAMASGIPVVATTHTGALDCIRQGENGFVVPIRDVEALASRLQWLHSHGDERRSMGKAARRRVEEEFSLERYCERLLSTYRTILDSASVAGTCAR